VFTSTKIIDAGNAYRKSLAGVLIKQGYIDVDDPELYSQVSLYILFAVGMAMLSCSITQCVCSESATSGLPEMKSILGGSVKPVLLSKRLIVAKYFGLISAICAGLSAGREGPFVHIAAAVADNLMKLSPFRDVFDKDIRRLEILSHACAAGVSATMGSAFGGVLFAIEFCSTSYIVRMLPEAFATAVVTIVIMSLLGRSQSLIFVAHSPATSGIPGTGPLDEAANLASMMGTNPLYPTNMPLYGYGSNARRGILDTSLAEIAMCLGIGLFCGGLGICFVFVVDTLSRIRNKYLSEILHPAHIVLQRKYLLVFVATLIISSLQLWELVYGLHGREAPVYIFATPFEARAHKGLVELDARDASLIMFFCYKFLVTAMSVTLPLPVGLFQPVFLCGGVLGRFIGERIHCIAQVSTGSGQHNAFISSVDFLSPREFALVGAAAFSTGVTSAVSTAAILYELSDSPHLCLPISLAIIAARALESYLYINVYEALSVTGGLPYFPEMPPGLRRTPVSDIMLRVCNTDFLTTSSSYRDLKAVVLSARSDYVAIVECRASMRLVAVVATERLENILAALEQKIDEEEQDEESVAGLLGNFQLRSRYGTLDMDSSTVSNNNHRWLRAEWTERVLFCYIESESAEAGASPPASLSASPVKGMPVVHADSSPFSVLDTTALSKADLCFRRLCLNTAYVCVAGRLVGFITRKQLCTIYLEYLVAVPTTSSSPRSYSTVPTSEFAESTSAGAAGAEQKNGARKL